VLGSGSENTPPSSAAETSAAIKEMYAKINDIIQMSSENMITTKNAWNVGVSIDSLLDTALDEGIVEDKEGEKARERSGAEVMRRRRSGGFGRAGVNFQKASCKLDASVKIYSARVDDTHSSSYRVLETLTRSGQGDAERAADQDCDKPAGNAVVGEKSTSNKFCLATTLEKVPGNLNAPPVAELQVDPSFHKMSSLFDEGGSSGMLLYNLCLEPSLGCCVAFGDSKAPTTGAAATGAAAIGAAATGMESDRDNSAAVFEDAAGLVDVSSLVARLGRSVEELSGGAGLASLQLCPRLSALRSETAAAKGQPLPSPGALGGGGAVPPAPPAGAGAHVADAGEGVGAAGTVSPAGFGGGGGDWCPDNDSDGEDNGEAGDLNMCFDDDVDDFGAADGEDAGFAPCGASPVKSAAGDVLPRGRVSRGVAAQAAVLESVLGLEGDSFSSSAASEYVFGAPFRALLK